MFSTIQAKKFVVFVLGFVAFVFLPLLLCPAYAQVTGATLSGTLAERISL